MCSSKILGTADCIRIKLREAGYRSISSWAVSHGYKPATARRVIYVWGQRSDREPHGGIARALIRDLRHSLTTDTGRAKNFAHNSLNRALGGTDEL